MKVTQLIDRFGSNRMNAEAPGKLLTGCTCIAVPFAGGMCEVPHFKANVVLVNDLDRHVINLCNIVRERRQELVQWLDATPYHPDQLARSQQFCKRLENTNPLGMNGEMQPPDLFRWACHYFVASWMTRGGNGGCKDEFNGPLSIRWKSGGGDSVVRFRSATEGLEEWSEVMRRCTFTTEDCFDFLAKFYDRDGPEQGLYVDAPWPEDGESYKHNLGENGQENLKDVLESFRETKIVVRFGDTPVIQALYSPEKWTWRRLEGRTQANKAKQEVLLTRNI